MKEKKLREVIDSANVDHYKLPKRLKDKLKAFDKMLSFIAGSRSIPCLRLFRADYVDLDTLVRRRATASGLRQRSNIAAIR